MPKIQPAVAWGPPETVAEAENSLTARYLKPYLNRHRAGANENRGK